MLKFVCTNCRYVYNPYSGDEENEIDPGTDFSLIDEYWLCPICSSQKEDFIELVENINELSNLNDPIPQEELHTAFYFEEGDKIIVQMGTDDEPYVQDDVHFVEYISIFDSLGEEIDTISFPDTDKHIEFDLPDEEYEIRACCSQHGIWKGINTLK